jgi:hypothetical protein
MRRRNWTLDELVLALELYLRSKPSQLDKKGPELASLAKLTGRSTDAVYMKLCNFLSLDPKYHGDGLAHNARGDRDVWKQYAGEPGSLSRAATAARRRFGGSK